jgi:hypothetical protein|eukprot:COSAG02_NODE_1675_length_11374_cov_3.988559_8_plen_80_part_00
MPATPQRVNARMQSGGWSHVRCWWNAVLQDQASTASGQPGARLAAKSLTGADVGVEVVKQPLPDGVHASAGARGQYLRR